MVIARLGERNNKIRATLSSSLEEMALVLIEGASHRMTIFIKALSCKSLDETCALKEKLPEHLRKCVLW